MQEFKDLNDGDPIAENLTRGEVIKLIPEIESGIIETEDDELLFFHISSFLNKDIGIEDINKGDLIVCQKEVQKSDGKKSAIRCEKLEMKEHVKKYLIENALTAPGDVELFDEFCEKARDYSEQVGREDFRLEDKLEIKRLINDTKTVMELKLIRPKLAIITSKYGKNKLIVGFLEMLDEIIKNIKPGDGNTEEVKNFKVFIDILLSYMEIA